MKRLTEIESGFELHIQENAWWESFNNQARIILEFMKQFRANCSSCPPYYANYQDYLLDLDSIIEAFEQILAENLETPEVEKGLNLYSKLFLTFWD